MFNPLGHFDPNADVDWRIVAKARTVRDALPTLPAGLIDRAYYHWTVAPMGRCFSDYNGEARYVNGNWLLTVTHDPSDNARGYNSRAEAAHTYRRNVGAIGVAITGMDGANVNVHNFGNDPVTVMGLQHLCAIMAAFCVKYGIDTQGNSTAAPYAGERNLLTHAEAAILVGNPAQYVNYGVTGTYERWDLGSFAPLPSGVSLSVDMVRACGDALRLFTHRIAATMKEKP